MHLIFFSECLVSVRIPRYELVYGVPYGTVRSKMSEQERTKKCDAGMQVTIHPFIFLDTRVFDSQRERANHVCFDESLYRVS